MSRLLKFLRAKLTVCLAASFLVGSLAPVGASAETQYFYDDLERLILVAYPDGTSVYYEYDALGNFTGVYQWAADELAIGGFSPSSGPTGTQVTITGSGFHPATAENTVTIGGATATIDSASSSSLLVTVPPSAQTGPIEVATGGNSVVSSQSFTVLRPGISGFSPAVVNPGDAVTLQGENLNLHPGFTSIRVAGVTANITTLNNSEAAFEAPGVSGPVVVDTDYGQAHSATSLIVVPAVIDAEDVVDVSVPDPEQSGSVSINQASGFGLLVFDAEQGERINLKILSATTTPAGASIQYEVFSPTGASLLSGSFTAGSQPTYDLGHIGTTGLHQVAFTAPGSSQTDVDAIIERYPVLNPDGSPLVVTNTVAGEDDRFVFSATTGDNLSLALTDLTMGSGSYVRMYVYRPDGSHWKNLYCYASYNPGCSLNLRGVPQTGYYQVLVEPYTHQANYTLTLSQHVDAGTLAVDTPQTVAMTAPGQRALLDFTATQGQTFALGMDSITTTPSGATMTMQVFGPTGGSVGSVSHANQGTLNLTNLAAGTYTIELTPYLAATGSVQLELATGLVGTLPSDGSSQNFATTVPGQKGHFTFSATTGDNLSLALTDLTMGSGSYLRMYVYRPDGSQWKNVYCYTSYNPGCSLNLRGVPQTGDYQVLVDPFTHQANYTLTLSQHVDAGTLAVDTPQTVAMTAPGQRALLDFTATQGQTFALRMDSIATTPSGASMTLQVFGPTGSSVGSVSHASQETLNLTNLTAGSYTVELTPYQAATGSVQVELATGLVGTLPSDGSSQNFATTVPGQEGRFTFPATAGDDLSLALTDLTMGSGSYLRMYVYRPDGSHWKNVYCYTSYNPGCSLNLRGVPQTGDYQVLVDPFTHQANYTLTLSQHVDAGTLVVDTPQTVAMTAPGQRALLDFTATQGQTFALSMDSITTTPSGASITMQVFGPTGGSVGSVSHASQGTLNLTNLAAGSYTVELTPYLAATGSVQVELQ